MFDKLTKIVKFVVIMKHNNHELYMRRALELAKLAIGHTSPNPAVGAIIVNNGQIIGEGWHRQYGGAHAEVNAINSVADKKLLPNSTIYVTLEPCAHWGKTPPCCDLIIAHKIPCVVIGTIDPFAKVDGQGIRRMKKAGIEVITNILEKECKQINAPFFTTHTLKRPYIILKWAQTADRYMDIIRTAETPSKWFTGNGCRAIVHRMRSQNNAIMVGTNTVILDNPTLTTRSYFGKNPIRITIDKNLILPVTANIFDNQAQTILFTTTENIQKAIDKFAHQTNITVLPLNYSTETLPQIITHLYNNNIQSLIVEGGPTLLNSFISQKLFDKVVIFESPQTLTQIYNSSESAGLHAPILNISSKEEINSKKFGCKILVL